MAVTISEKANGRSGDVFSRQVEYVVKGTDSDTIAIDNVLTLTDSTGVLIVPAVWDGLTQTTVAVEQQGPTIWYATVSYGQTDSGGGGGPAAGTVVYNFETATENVRITRSLQTTKTPGDGPDFQHGINIREDGSFEGVDISVPVSTFSYDFKLTAGSWSQAYIQNVEQTVGKVNSVPWRNRQAGEVLLAGVAGSESTDGQPTLSFRFKYAKNSTVTLSAGFDNIAKAGWDYLWVYSKKRAELEAGGDYRVQPKIECVYVERVYDRVSFLTNLGF